MRTTWVPLAEDGSFTLTNVQPGKYRLRPELPPPYSRGFTTGPDEVEPNLEVGNTDISGLVLSVEATMPVDLAGTVIFDAGAKPVPVIIHLMQGDAVQAQTASLDDGSFVLRGVPPGKYRLSAHSAGPGGTPVSARLGDTDLPYGELELKGPNPGSLEITVSSVFARVEGVALTAAKYVLFRASKPGLQPIGLATIDSGGHFTARLRPGEYHVWLAAEMPANLWDDKDARQGQIVTIVQGENAPLRIVMPAVK